MRFRPFLLLGIAALALAPAEAGQPTERSARAPGQGTVEQLPVFIPSSGLLRTRAGETYRNAARSADR